MSQATKVENSIVTIDLGKIYNTKLETSPYDYLVASDFIRQEWKERLLNAYPEIKAAGSFPLSTVPCSAEFMCLIDDMNSDAFRQAVEEKFSLNLEGKPTLFTVRGKCRLKDGQVHTDSESKIITVLLYMNPSWEGQNGGRLRVLRSTRIDDVAAEILPEIGNLLIFRRCDYSYHGHLPFEGPRRVIQMNWVSRQEFADREKSRHRWSAFFKNFAFRGGKI